jgi:hypothetical protein
VDQSLPALRLAAIALIACPPDSLRGAIVEELAHFGHHLVGQYFPAQAVVM